MLFCSQAYLVFFVCVFAVYWALPWHRARIWLLLAASFYFYASWNHWLACLIGASTLVDYALARLIDAPAAPPRRRQALLALSIVGNLALLGYFKYANFFLESLNASLEFAGLSSSSLALLEVILPVGISFYTFEAINYMVDVYRRKVPAERDLANFMLFITFFPHLVAGPIVRARDFLPQTHRPKRWDWARLNLGAQFFLLGLIKKLVIADRMAAFVDPVFEHPELYPAHTLWMAVLAYPLQVYGDFSGYTDMALGSAHLLGFKLAQNFNAPYLARNIADFWQRWHISLSTWLRDYLFIPLGGSRGGRARTCLNLLITMTLGGLWHGAGWVYVLWGVMHGLLLVIHRLFAELVRRRLPWADRALRSVPGTVACVVFTYLVFCLTLIFFRSPTLDVAGQFFRGLLGHAADGVLLARSPVHHLALVFAYLLVALDHWMVFRRQHRERRSVRLALKQPAALAGVGYAVVLTFVLLLAPASGKVFIYFQF